MLTFWAYILRCADGSYYTGHTDRLEYRIAQHQAGEGGDWTRRRRPVALVWSQEFPSRYEALAAERQIKPWSRAKKEALIAGDWDRLSWFAKPPHERPSTSLGTNEEGSEETQQTAVLPKQSRGAQSDDPTNPRSSRAKSRGAKETRTMPPHTASCRCGQLRATVIGEPVRVSVCHCRNCKKRSGSAFAAQARWPDADVTIEGRSKPFSMVGDSGARATFHFCPECGSDVHYALDSMPGMTGIPLGAFDGPSFLTPTISVYENRKPDWLAIVGDGIVHD